MPKYDLTISEEQLKNLVRRHFFSEFNADKVPKKIDFCVSFKDANLFDNRDLVWAEAKKGVSDLCENFTQLVLTIANRGKKMHEEISAPAFLAVFNATQIAFVEFSFFSENEVFDIMNFNYNVKPSNYKSSSFTQMLNILKKECELEKNMTIFSFENEEKQLKEWIRKNLIINAEHSEKIEITKSNFATFIYQLWTKKVLPSIAENSWDDICDYINPSDFYLADVLSKNNDTESLKDSLRIVLDKTQYKVKEEIVKNIKNHRRTVTEEDKIGFNDNQLAHTQFWNKFKRPPKEEIQNYILDKRHLLIPKNIRERKGAFYTPPQWVKKAHEYLKNTFRGNYEEDYYIWDCAAGTGNLLRGLKNSSHLYASTLDKSDVGIMKTFIDEKENGFNLLEKHIFQFDFLNDPLFDTPCEKHICHTEPPFCHTEQSEVSKRQNKRDVSPMAQHDKLGNPAQNDTNEIENCQNCIKSKLPPRLQEIIKNEPQNLIILINPPYAEAPRKKFYTESKKGVQDSTTNLKYKSKLGQGNRELFAQFLTRIYFEIPHCKLAQFSTLKHIQGTHFVDFRKFFLAKCLKAFVVPASTFDNVNGEFPIGFFIWDLNEKEKITKCIADVYSKNNAKIGEKVFYAFDNNQYINEWIKPYRAKKDDKNIIAKFPFMGNDFQQQNIIQINHPNMIYNKAAGQFLINPQNLIIACVYFAVRKAIKATWINDRDQFLAPLDSWISDKEFQSDCLAYTLFSNNIQSKFGVNHFIPFNASELRPKEGFLSEFMYRFINGKIQNVESQFCHTEQSEVSNKQSKRDVSLNAQLDKVESKKANVESQKETRSKLTQGSFKEMEEYTPKKINFIPQKPLEFSKEAKEVFNAAKELFIYYHEVAKHSENYLNDAALYDIKAYFQGYNAKNKMNAKSEDEGYNARLDRLKLALKELSAKIEPKIYEHGFLLK